MKVIICGGRNFRGNSEQEGWLINQLKQLQATEVVCGMAKGADLFGLSIAERMNITVKMFPADWRKFGKSAGYIRNNLMAKHADVCISFPGGKGTADMRNRALAHGLKLIKYTDS